MNWYIAALKNYVNFSGRARRKEYWFFVLFNTLISLGLGFIDGFAGTLDPETGMGVLSGIYSLAVLLPSIAVCFRRLHDTGRSAWWLFLFLIPLIGAIVLLVFFVQDSEQEDNKYGASPKLAE